MAELRKQIGTRIRAIRNAKGLTQQKLADIASLDYRYIGALERGERNFSIDTLEKVLTALNVSISELMFSEEHMTADEMIRQEAIDEFVALTSRLNEEQIGILRRVSKEVSRAFD
ncbi:transcriptional regulator with XRE-family HTH domain [Paenibacillus jamilae]|jgi:transcriptional regulator with XRE-family HTH domain|uniref:helix-turn-helix domain-containing protein n=1 Tax=Paenibacillus TaxID=44249 RepID=UPI000D31B7EA|nr:MULTISPECIES: helix-turn-helix transcriptional regulator [Paenibacillus]MDP9677779.1 transcriptional regulator with XRE-family HTH domain [Paenibacillus jamilae]KAF6621554.1 helix-turn-helix transcriptional regulator [Paenibacillus sp. EKM101P]KAF6622859.1 helix-turn-helix transcriptional regulator [Paenibacillus sp. EKM102P]KAF6632712.1 helix-turn-helix transcriptional regulator [Paenibacillus sp. EKM10P]KAF6647463.1 helix-turn-helix transcriptional regulator [Paenibacillus sp. EKM11P]